MIRLTQGGFNRLADEHGFIVVYPEGVKPLLERRARDARQVLRRRRRGLHPRADRAAIRRSTRLIRQRIYVTGISNGGHMSYRLACDLSDQIAGIAPVVALMPAQSEHVCAPDSPGRRPDHRRDGRPACALQRRRASACRLIAPARRGRSRRPKPLRFWAAANGCVGDPDRDRSARPPTRTTARASARPSTLAAPLRSSCTRSSAAGIPGRAAGSICRERIVGKTSREIDANQVIWDFFRSLDRVSIEGI